MITVALADRTYAAENHFVLTEVLRGDWGYDGVVMSDWFGSRSCEPTVNAGLDLEMPPAKGRSPEAVVAAVQAGEVPTDVLDARVRTVLELVAKGMPVLGLDESFDADAHHALAREAAAESVVLLKAYVLAAIPVGLTEYATAPLEHLGALLSPADYATFRKEYEARRASRVASAAPWN